MRGDEGREENNKALYSHMLRGSTTLLSAPPRGRVVGPPAPPAYAPLLPRHTSVIVAASSKTQPSHSPTEKRKAAENPTASQQGGVSWEGYEGRCVGRRMKSKAEAGPESSDAANTRSKHRITIGRIQPRSLAVTDFFSFLRSLY